ncbi:MAG TPA: FAD-binding oxidoreductase [Anaeromyxobacter sp.]|nr:FAD-binding oxidoreductase [Anaeromyxobacter sp.]
MPTETSTLDGGKLVLDAATLDALQARLRGPVLAPGIEGFDDACRIWNGMIRSRPALVVRATGTADVVECVRFAAQHRILVSAKCGGHNIAGTSLAAGGLTIDLSRMKGVLVDPALKVARVQAGCLLGDVDRETQLHGLATVLGFVSETGVAGLTLGGGFGYLTRRFGYTVDNLLEVELVAADGRVLRASAEENADLFWAVRGGGGNFGIVTAFTFRLHAVGPTITGGLIAWPAEEAPQVLARYRDVTSEVGRELTLATTMRLAPPAPFVPKEWHGKPIIGIVACHTGSRSQAEKDFAPIKTLGKPIFDLIVEKPYVQQQSMLDATQPKGLHYYWKSEYLRSLSDAALATFRAHGVAVPSPQSQIVLFHLEGAISERTPDEGAVGNRDVQYVLGVAGAWTPDDPGAQRHLAWVRAAWDSLRPHATGGVYVNFLTEDEGEDRVRAAYRDNFARLAAVKAKYDPENLFRSNKNIAPTRGSDPA